MTGVPSAAAGLVLGESLHQLGSFTEAEEVLAEATERAAGDDELVRIATVRRRNLFWGSRRDAEAIAVVRAVVPRLASRAARDELLTGEAEVLAFSGRPADALALLDRVDVSVPRVAVLAADPRAAALAIMGRTAEAVTVSQRGYDEHVALGDELAIAQPGTHVVNRTWALTEAGRLAEAEELGRTWVDLSTRARTPRGVAWFSVHLARCAVTQGRAATALRWGERARVAAESGGYYGLKPITTALLAVAHALLGDAAASAAQADQIDAGVRGFGIFDAELTLGRAWALVAAGRIPAARAALVSAAEDAERARHVPVAAWLLHDAVRLGAVGAAARLARLTAATDSFLVAARAEHAAALADDDADRLADAADRFGAMGALLLAAEAAAAAARSWRRRGDRRRATALVLRSGELAGRCEGAKTPGLITADAIQPLTAREREIALLAAAGHPSRLIAERLHLSARTVDNHLSRIYEKLGISGRAGLPGALETERR